MFPAEGDVAGLITWITASNTTDEAVSGIDQARAALAEAHTRLPPGRVLRMSPVAPPGSGAAGWWPAAFAQARELFRIDADLLAHAGLLLDDIQRGATAKAHGAAAMLCAEERPGHSRAYALSAQAKTARWQGVRRGGREGAPYFARSADLARQGFELSPDAPVRVLLANQEASASALLGNAARARRALQDAREAASSPRAGRFRAVDVVLSSSASGPVCAVGGDPAARP